MAGKKITDLSSGSLSNLPLSGVTAVVYSGTTFQHSITDLRNKLVDSGSHYFTGSQHIIGDLTVSGSIIAHDYILSSSITNIEIQNVSGSSNFGNDLEDTHIFTGSVIVTGSVDVSGSQKITENLIIGLDIHHDSGDPEVLHAANSGSYNIAHFQGDNEYYTQINVVNLNSSSLSSTDIVATADNGNETVHFVNLGINSSTYNGGYVGYENDAYLLNVGKDLFIGTIGGTSHPAKLKLFAQNEWENPQITIHTGSQVTFNTSSFTDGYTYEFSGSVKLQNDLTVDGTISSSFVGDGSGLYNLTIPSTDVSMFVSSSIFETFTSSYTSDSASFDSRISAATNEQDLSNLATTGSNTFVGDQTISGSFTINTMYTALVAGVDSETATDSQGGSDTLTFSAWIEGSGGIDYPTIVNVQSGWTVTGPGLSAGATVSTTNVLEFSPEMSVYQITLVVGNGLFQTGETYTFTEPATEQTINNQWIFESGSNLIAPNGSNIIGVGNLATTGSNTFVGNQIISGSIYMGTGSIILPNGTEIYDTGNLGSNTSGIGLGNNGFSIDFGSNVNDWAIFRDANLIQMQPTDAFRISIPSIGEGGWTFNASGLSFPDDTIQTTAFTGFTEGLVSGSSQISYTGITDTPSGIISGSSQISDLGYATTGSNTFNGNQTITGSLLIQGSGGSEGGELNMSYAETTSLTGSNVVVDVYEDTVRIFEDGGNNRGVFLNVASQSNSVSSEIVTSTTLSKIETMTSSSYASITPVSGTLYIIID